MPYYHKILIILPTMIIIIYIISYNQLIFIIFTNLLTNKPTTFSLYKKFYNGIYNIKTFLLYNYNSNVKISYIYH